MKEELCNKKTEALQEELTKLREELDKREKKIQKEYGSSTGRDNEKSSKLYKWYFAEVKKIKAKYKT